MLLPHIAMVLSWLWYWLWSVFDVSSSYCHGTVMVMVLTVVCVLMFLIHTAMVLPWLLYWLWSVFWCCFLILPWYCHGCGTDCNMCSDASSSYCHGTVMVMVLTVVCVLMLLPHIAMVLSWLWYGLWYVFWCFLFILPWYCHGYGTDCGLCSDVSYSYCHGTVMVIVLTVVCVLMFLPHIATVLPWLWYWLWSVFWRFFLILPWYCHVYGTDCGMCFDVASSYCHGSAMFMVLTVVCVLMFLPHIAMVLTWLWYWL